MQTPANQDVFCQKSGFQPREVRVVFESPFFGKGNTFWEPHVLVEHISTCSTSGAWEVSPPILTKLHALARAGLCSGRFQPMCLEGNPNPVLRTYCSPSKWLASFAHLDLWEAIQCPRSVSSNHVLKKHLERNLPSSALLPGSQGVSPPRYSSVWSGLEIAWSCPEKLKITNHPSKPKAPIHKLRD